MEKFFALILAAAILFQVSSADAADFDLEFEPSSGVEKTLTLNGREVKFIAYENLPYGGRCFEKIFIAH